MAEETLPGALEAGVVGDLSMKGQRGQCGRELAVCEVESPYRTNTVTDKDLRHSKGSRHRKSLAQSMESLWMSGTLFHILLFPN